MTDQLQKTVVGMPVPASPTTFADRMRAHHQHIEAHQRASGIRARQCAAGCFTLYNQQGQHIGRTVSAANAGCTPAALRTIAARMAYSEELAHACRLVDLDYEANGGISAETVARVRQLLATIAAAP